MPIEVTLENFEFFIENLKEHVGKDFVNALISTNINGFPDDHNVRRTNREQIVESSRQRLNAHPLAEMVQAYLRDSRVTSKEGRWSLSDHTFFLLDLVANLNRGREFKNFDRVIDQIKERSKFHSAAFELMTACRYADIGYKIEFVEECNEKTPDILARHPLGDIQVECKSLEDNSGEQHNLFMQMAARLGKILEDRRALMHVSIRPKIPLSGKVCDDLYNAVAEMIKSNRIGLHALMHSLVVVEIKPTNPWRKLSFPSDIYNEDYDASYAQLIKKSDYFGEDVRLLSMVEIQNFYESDFSGALKRNFRKAHKQVRADIPAVLHIEVPYRKGLDLMASVHENYNKIEKYLSEYNKFCAVEIVGRALARATDNLIRDPIIYHSRLVRSRRLQERPIIAPLIKQYPPDMVINGTGTIVAKIIKPRNYNSLTGRELISLMSGDGFYQIIIWVTFRNSLRVEVITPESGRRMQDIQVDWGNLPEKIPITVSWSPEGIAVFLEDTPQEMLGVEASWEFHAPNS